jgi:flagellar assembly factor FliW
MISSVHFLESLAGLPGSQDYVLTPLDDDGLLFTLRGGAAGAPRLFMVQPGPYFAEYEPTIAGDALTSLGLTAHDDRCAVLVIVTPGSEEAPTTANLLAPIVLNTETGDALQVILDGEPWPLRAPLVAA